MLYLIDLFGSLFDRIGFVGSADQRVALVCECSVFASRATQYIISTHDSERLSNGI